MSYQIGTVPEDGLLPPKEQLRQDPLFKRISLTLLGSLTGFTSRERGEYHRYISLPVEQVADFAAWVLWVARSRGQGWQAYLQMVYAGMEPQDDDSYLVTPDCHFERWKRGELTPDQAYQAFVERKLKRYGFEGDY